MTKKNFPEHTREVLNNHWILPPFGAQDDNSIIPFCILALGKGGSYREHKTPRINEACVRDNRLQEET